MKKSTLYFIAICLQMWLFSNAYAQSGEIQGKVTDVETGETLPFVNIAIDLSGSLVGATSDFDGVYTLVSIRPGIYTVTFSYAGYQTMKVEKVKVEKDKTTFLNITLTASYEPLEAVKIIEYGSSLVGFDQNRERVIANEIKSMPTRDVNSIVGGCVYRDKTETKKSNKKRKQKNLTGTKPK